TRNEKNGGSQLDEHYFQDIMTWILKKGRGSEEARSVALSLTKKIIKLVDDGNEEVVKPLLTPLLADFPEISWPLIGQAIAVDKKAAWKFEHLLGDMYSFRGTENPPILSLPADTLFAWCHANPETAPAFLSVVIPVLTSRNPDDVIRTIHPVMRRLIDE